jgi:hypothetical protein
VITTNAQIITVDVANYNTGTKNYLKITYNNSLVIPLGGSIEVVFYTDNF